MSRVAKGHTEGPLELDLSGLPGGAPALLVLLKYCYSLSTAIPATLAVPVFFIGELRLAQAPTPCAPSASNNTRSSHKAWLCHRQEHK